MIGDFFSLSFKNLKHRGIRSWLTLLGILIGVAAVVSLISLGDALKLTIGNQFGIANTELITVQAGGMSNQGPPGSYVVNPLTTDDVEKIKKLGSVKRAVRRNIGNVQVEYNDKMSYSYLASIPDGDDREFIYDQIDENPVTGRFLKDSDSHKVFLGYSFYNQADFWGKEIIPGKTILLNGEEFEVMGILDKTGSFIFDGCVYMNQKDMTDLLDLGDVVDVIAVQPTDKNEMDKTKEDIEKLMRKQRNVKEGEEDFEVSTPEAMMGTINSIIGGVQIFIIVIASISIFIGIIGIVNTMTTSVLERKKDIGIMKSIGATNEHIFLQFLIESGMLGLMGGFIGAVMGLGFGIVGTNALNSLIGGEIEPVINIWLLIYCMIGSFVVGAIAGIVPALNAARQNPVEALRG